MRKFEQYRFRDNDILTARVLNQRFEDIDLRIHNLEELKVSWEEAVREIQNYGLLRINEAVSPLINDLQTQADSLVNQLQTELDSLNTWKADVDGNVNSLQTDVSTLQSGKADTDLNNVTSLGNLLNLDGAGSGLDADLLDGKQYSDIKNEAFFFSVAFGG